MTLFLPSFSLSILYLYQNTLRNFSTSVEIPSDRWPYNLTPSYPCYEHVSTIRSRVSTTFVYISISKARGAKFRHYTTSWKILVERATLPRFSINEPRANVSNDDLPDAACTSVTLTMATLLTTTSRRVITVYLSVLMGFACGDTVSRIRGENSALYRERGECKRDAVGSIYSLISRKDEFDEWARSLRSSTRVSIHGENRNKVNRSSLVL